MDGGGGEILCAFLEGTWMANKRWGGEEGDCCANLDKKQRGTISRGRGIAIKGYI